MTDRTTNPPNTASPLAAVELAKKVLNWPMKPCTDREYALACAVLELAAIEAAVKKWMHVKAEPAELGEVEDFSHADWLVRVAQAEDEIILASEQPK